MVAVRDTVDMPDAERRFLLTYVPWPLYMAMRDALDSTRVHMTYLAGRLELMRPSKRHEEESKILARLLEACAEENDVDLRGFKSTTFRNELQARGAEPDECYTLGPLPEDGPPQLVIEVVVANPLIDKLEVYAGLGVPEVWVWQSTARTLALFRRSGAAYVVSQASALLPQLDVTLLASFVRTGENQTALVKAYRAALRATRKS